MTELLLVNGNILTMDSHPSTEDAIAIRDGKILAVGDRSRLDTFTSSHPRIIDLQGQTILPGFIDAHLHFRALAESLVTVSLAPQSGIRSITDIIHRIQKETQKLAPGTWIRAGGYNDIYLAEKRHPDRLDLDKAAPNHPVKLTHRSGHAHVLNSLGLKLAGIHKETDDPLGGIIERDFDSGNPTGLLWGMNDFLSKTIPPIDDVMLSRGVQKAEQQLLSCGITSFQDASPRNDRNRWQWYEQLKDRGQLRPRTAMMVGREGLKEHQADAFSARISSNNLCLSGVKIVLDETTGKLNPDLKTLKEVVYDAHRAGYQIALHAIEPSAIEAAVEALFHALDRFPRKDHRHRIEHCSVCPPELIKKIAALGVLVTTHPAFLFFSGDRYLQTVPVHQQPYLYPIASLLKAGIGVAAASDSPIADVMPIPGIYSAVTRLSETGKSLLKNEAISPENALKMYTLNSAMAQFREKIIGTISPGKLADFVVLSDDPLHVPDNSIKDITVEMTMIGGEVVYVRKEC